MVKFSVYLNRHVFVMLIGAAIVHIYVKKYFHIKGWDAFKGGNSIKIIFAPSQNVSTQKRKKILPWGENHFFVE